MAEEDDVVEIDAEENLYFSSAYYKKPIKLNSNDIKEKLVIAKRIIKATKENLSEEKNQEPILIKLHNYTGLPKEDLKEIIKNLSSRDRSFENAFKNVTTISDGTLKPLCDDIRSIFATYYVELKQFPSKSALLGNLKNMGVDYIDEHLSIQKLVKNKLIQYLHFPEYNRYILTEHPELIYKRTMYLKKIEQCRKQNKNMVYIELRKMYTKYGTKPAFTIGLAVLSITGQLEKMLTAEVGDKAAEMWLTYRVLPQIRPNSVVVLSQPKTQRQKKLTPYSEKMEFIEWLNDNNIPYGKVTDIHTAEAYSLYKTFEKKVNVKTAYDNIFQRADIEVIHCPSKWRSLNYFSVVWDEINTDFEKYARGIQVEKIKIQEFKRSIGEATKWLGDNYFKREATLIKTENKTLRDDSVIETIIDNLMEMINNKEVKNLDFPSYSCGDKTEFFETHVCNFLID